MGRIDALRLQVLDGRGPEMKLSSEDGLARLRKAMNERRQIDVGAPDDRDTWRTTQLWRQRYGTERVTRSTNIVMKRSQSRSYCTLMRRTPSAPGQI